MPKAIKAASRCSRSLVDLIINNKQKSPHCASIYKLLQAAEWRYVENEKTHKASSSDFFNAVGAFDALQHNLYDPDDF